jgi:sugar phosphate isomerase/epimerase
MQCAVEGIASAGGSVCTVHVNARPFLTIRDCWNQAVDVLGRLGDIGQKNGVVAAVETGYPSTVEDYCGLIEAANHPNVGACIDVGHIFRYYPNDLFGTEAGIEAHNSILEQIVRRLGAKVAILHLHDNRREDFRDHRAPGRGIIDFPRLMRALDDIDFQGPMVLELEEPDMLDALREGREFLGMIVRNIDS